MIGKEVIIIMHEFDKLRTQEGTIGIIEERSAFGPIADTEPRQITDWEGAMEGGVPPHMVLFDVTPAVEQYMEQA